MEAAAAVSHSPSPPLGASPVWNLGWLTPARCRVILIALLAFGFLSHLDYLRNDCPIDLSGDEAQYWDWSRRLDINYYSKGPLAAFLIRASCAAFGDVMWAVRLPALVLGIGTSLVTYLLTLKLFRSDRLALGAVLVNHIVPMFIAGSVLMTIDPPFFFCWALATYLAALTIFDRPAIWKWVAIGVVVGVGFLAKYAMLAWLPTILLVLWLDPLARRQLRSPGPWVAVAVALLFTIPFFVWNARHGWVSALHVGKQTGTDGSGGFTPLRVLEFLGGQIAVIGPPLFVLLVAGALYATRRRREDPASDESRRTNFLLWVALPFFAVTTLVNVLAKVQINWPAPAYFTGMILLAYYLSTRLADPAKWRPWRSWFYPAVIFGLLMMPVAHDFGVVYPLIAKADGIARKFGKEIPIRKFDPTVKLRGWEELGAAVGTELAAMDPGTFVVAEDYQTTAELAFYVPGQPRTYCAGPYFDPPSRYSQYDMWPDRSLDVAENPALLGRDAIYVGWFKADLWDAFESVEELPQLDIERRGSKIRRFRVWRCHNFRGLTRPEAGRKY